MNPPGVIEWPLLSSVTMTTPGGYFFNCEKKKGSRFKRLEAVQVLLTAAAGVVNPQIESTFQNSQKPWSSVKSDMYFFGYAMGVLLCTSLTILFSWLLEVRLYFIPLK